MCVKIFAHSMWWLNEMWGTAEFKGDDRGELVFGLLRAGPGNIAANSGASIRLD
jgi:hypothetical protein